MARSMIALAALMTVMGSGGAALAASVDPSVTQMTFEAADRDGDGQVSEPELVADLAAAFNSLDANKDRALEESEVPQARPGARGASASRVNTSPTWPISAAAPRRNLRRTGVL